MYCSSAALFAERGRCGRLDGLVDRFSDRFLVEEVDFHAGVDHDLLRDDSARDGTQQKYSRRGGFVGGNGTAARNRLFGEKVTVEVAGNAGAGRGFEQTGRDGVEPDLGKLGKGFREKGKRRVERRFDRRHIAVVFACHTGGRDRDRNNRGVFF